MRKRQNKLLLMALAVILLIFSVSVTASRVPTRGDNASTLETETIAQSRIVSQTESATETIAQSRIVSQTESADVADDTVASAYAQSAADTVSDDAMPEESGDPTEETSTRAAAASAVKNESAAATELFSGLPQKDMLRAADDVRYYRFRAKERGSLRYTITANEKADLSGRIVSLYQVYYLNGTDGEKGVRLLNYMQAYTTQKENTSPNIGIIPGEYLLAVQAGVYADLGVYEILLTFTPGTDYEIEYNDAASRYTEIFSGVPVRGSASGRRDGTDTDWFMIRMHQPGALLLQFEHATQATHTTAFRVSVYNAEMQEIYSGLSAQDLALLESGVLGVPAGAYFICVEARVLFQGDYRLTVTKSAADLYEKERNDTRKDALPLQDGRPMTGALSARQNAPDRDWYRIDLSENGLVTLTLSAEPSAPDENDPDLSLRRVTLYDEFGRILYRALMPQSKALLSSGAVGLSAGVYFVQVDHDDLHDSSVEYALRYTFLPANNCEREYNDVPLAASALVPGTPCVAALQDRGTEPDTDWFSFTLEKQAVLTLKLTHDNGDIEESLYRVELQNASGAPVADREGNRALVCGGGSMPATACYNLPAGEYYVRIAAGMYEKHGAYAIEITTDNG